MSIPGGGCRFDTREPLPRAAGAVVDSPRKVACRDRGGYPMTGGLSVESGRRRARPERAAAVAPPRYCGTRAPRPAHRAAPHARLPTRDTHYTPPAPYYTTITLNN